MTRQLVAAGQLVGAGSRWVMLDHLIIGQRRWISLRKLTLGIYWKQEDLKWAPSSMPT